MTQKTKKWHVDFTHPAFTRPVASTDNVQRCITCEGPLDSNQDNFCSRFCESLNKTGLDNEI